MFCPKCGNQIPEGTAFCSLCGTRAADAAATPANQMPPLGKPPKQPLSEEDKRNRLVGIIAVAVAAALVLAIVLTAGILIFGGRSYEAALDQLFTGIAVKPNAKKALDTLPDEVVVYIMDEDDYDKDERKDFTEMLQEELEMQIEEIEEDYGSFEVFWEITDTKDFTRRELRALQKEYEDTFGLEIDDAVWVEVDMVIEYEEEEEESTHTVCLIKIGRTWYMDLESFNDLL